MSIEENFDSYMRLFDDNDDIIELLTNSIRMGTVVIKGANGLLLHDLLKEYDAIDGIVAAGKYTEEKSWMYAKLDRALDLQRRIIKMLDEGRMLGWITGEMKKQKGNQNARSN